MTTYETIPTALANTPQWLCYRLVDTGKGRLSKPPFSPRTGYQCAKNDEREFTTLQEALVGVERYDMDGVGFVFTNGFVAIDLDDCFGEDGRLLSVPQDIFDHFTDTYWEYSPSGNGLHGFMYGEKPNERTKDAALHIEVYSGYNFVTVTGERVEGTNTEVIDMQDALEWLYEKYLPPIVSPNIDFGPVDHGDKTTKEWLNLGLSKDEKLASLYNATEHSGDESSTDFALLCKLAYWLNRDEEAIAEAFMASPWVRTKDAAHTKKLKREDYLSGSVNKATRLTATTAYETSKQYETKAIRFFMHTPQADGSESFALEDYTDLGNAEAMAEVFGDGLCYTEEWGWCFFNGVRWEIDATYRAMEAARDIAQGLMLSAKNWLERVRDELDEDGIAHDSEDGKRRLEPPMALYKHALKSQSEHGLTAMVALNKAYMIASATQFNADPWLLNTPKGVVDLKTGEMMPHDPKYRLTNMTAVAPEHKAMPMFDAFLRKIFCEDEELIEFAQVQLGSALVGKVYTENLIIANGNGSNGKSTLFNTVQYILGDYATSIDPDLLMSSKNGDNQQVGMAMLQGKRFAVAQETEEGQRLKPSMLKRLVSTDPIVAKRLYHNPHTFIPTHTLVLPTNHLPKVSSTDIGTWRRIVVLPFEATIQPSEIITDFHSLLMEREGGGILQWLIEGAVKFYELGCDIEKKPAAVQRASAEYRSAEDWVANFINEVCKPDPDPHDESVVTRHSDLYHAYQTWAKNSGEYVRSSIMFGRALQANGWRNEDKWYDKERGGTSKVWYGLSLTHDTKHFALVQGKKDANGVAK
jgi:P4 family phage/plasmid primase-like protien